MKFSIEYVLWKLLFYDETLFEQVLMPTQTMFYQQHWKYKVKRNEELNSVNVLLTTCYIPIWESLQLFYEYLHREKL